MTPRSRIYTLEILDVLRRLGINPEREAEVVDFGPVTNPPGYRAGNGWFHVVGHVIDGPLEMNGVDVSGPVHLAVNRNASLVPDSFGDQPVVQIEWAGAIPWVLGEPPDDRV